VVTLKVSCADHIKQIRFKARKLVGMNCRQFYALADTNTLLRIYLTCICPHLEYVCQLRDPQHNQGCTVTGIGTEIACKVCLLWDMNYEIDLQ